MRRDRNLRKRGEIYWYRIQKNGRTYEGSLETTVYEQAQERLARTRQQLKSSNWGEKQKRTFNEATDRFVKEHFKHLKPATRNRYLASIANLYDDLNGVFMDDIDQVKLGQFEERRKEQTVKGRKGKVKTPTIRRDLACLSVIFTLAQGWSYATHNPVKPYVFLRSKTKALPNSVPRERHLTQEEELEILQHAPRKAKVTAAFAIDTGLRKAEQFRLERRDLDFPRREIIVRAEISKTGRARRVPMLPRVYQLLKDMPADLRSPCVFLTEKGKPYSPTSPYYYEALQAAVRKANSARAKDGRPPMEHLEWHDLRRTCGCRLLQDMGFSMEEVSKWLGHRSTKVTEQHYAFLKVEQLHQAVARNEARVLELQRRNPQLNGHQQGRELSGFSGKVV